MLPSLTSLHFYVAALVLLGVVMCGTTAARPAPRNEHYFVFLRGLNKSGKSTLAAAVKAEYGRVFDVYMCGSRITAEIAKGTPLGKRYAKHLAEDYVVPSELLLKSIMRDAVDHSGMRLHLIEGSPRRRDDWRVITEEFPRYGQCLFLEIRSENWNWQASKVRLVCANCSHFFPEERGYCLECGSKESKPRADQDQWYRLIMELRHQHHPEVVEGLVNSRTRSGGPAYITLRNRKGAEGQRKLLGDTVRIVGEWLDSLGVLDPAVRPDLPLPQRG